MELVTPSIPRFSFFFPLTEEMLVLANVYDYNGTVNRSQEKQIANQRSP